MVSVTLVTNGGAGVPTTSSIKDGTTVEDFLNVFFDGNPDDFKIKIRSNGESVEYHEGYILQDEDRISLTPEKVEGAA